MQKQSVSDLLTGSGLLDTTIPLIEADKTWKWETGYTGAGWTIVVIDSGVSYSHQFLPNIDKTHSACFSVSEPSGGYWGACPGQNQAAQGDRVLQQSFGGNSGANCPMKSPDYLNICTIDLMCGVPGCGHGTAVAGIAAGNNSAYQGTSKAIYSGVAKDATILPINIFGYKSNYSPTDTLKTTGRCEGRSEFYCQVTSSEAEAKALDYVVNELVKGEITDVGAVNMSVGGGAYSDSTECDQDYFDVKAGIDMLRNFDVPTIIASGNEGRVSLMNGPACVSSAIAVGATYDSDVVVEGIIPHVADDGFYSVVAGFNGTNVSSGLAFFAPGATVFTSYPQILGDAFEPFKEFAGTSAAAPHLAGAWTLIRQKYPGLPIPFIQNMFEMTGTPVMDRDQVAALDAGLYTIKRTHLWRARIDVLKAIKATPPETNPKATDDSVLSALCTAKFAVECAAYPDYFKPRYCIDSNGDGIGEVVGSTTEICLCDVESVDTQWVLGGLCDDQLSPQCFRAQECAFFGCVKERGAYSEVGERKGFWSASCGDEGLFIGDACFGLSPELEALVRSIAQDPLQSPSLIGCFAAGSLFSNSCESPESFIDFVDGSCGGSSGWGICNADCGQVEACSDFSDSSSDELCEISPCSMVPTSTLALRALGGMLGFLLMSSPPFLLLIWRSRVRRRAKTTDDKVS